MKKIALALFLVVGAAACDGPMPEADAGTDGGPGQPDAQVERTPPAVVLTIPQDGEDEVAPTASIRVVFSEPIEVASGTIELETDGASVELGAPSASADRRELTVTPSAPLAGNTSYEVTVAGFRDDADNAMASAHVVSFTTSDPFAPTVVASTPAEGATDVSTGLATIELELSEAMNAALGVAELSGGPGTLGAPTWDGARVSFPVSGLAPDTAYRVTLTGFADPAGNALDGEAYLGDGALDFTTGGDTTAPVVTESSPAEGATGVPPTRTTRVRVVFSEPMDPSAGVAELDVDGTPTALEASWAAGGTILLVDVSGRFEEGHAYRITLSGFTDAVGNALDASTYLGDGALDFTTGDDELPPFVLFANPPEGATDLRWTANSLFVTFSEPMDTTRTTVPFDDGEVTSFFDATWSSGGALLEIDVAGKLLSGRTYVLDFTAFTDAEGAPLDAAHPYLGDGRLTFTMAAPEGENCQDYLRESEATVSGGVYTWSIASAQVTNVDGASPCDLSGGSADAVVRYVKTTPDSTAATGGRVLRVTVTSSGTTGTLDMNVDVLRNGCDPTSSVIERLECRTGGNPQTIELDVGPGEYYVWVAASSGAFRGATIQIEEVPAGLGDTCRNAIPITPGTTSITPSGAQSIFAPTCTAGGPLTWYRYTAGQRLGILTLDSARAVGAVEASSGQQMLCRLEANTTPMPVVVEPGQDVCLAVRSGAATTITIEERPYTGVRGIPVDLGMTYPSGVLSAPSSPVIVATPTRIYAASGSGAGSAISYMHAPRSGGATIERVLTTAAQRIPGLAGVTIGEAYYTVARNAFDPTSPQPMVLQMIDASGMPLDPPLPVDTTQPYVAATSMTGIVVDGSNFLYVQGSAVSSGQAHFYSVPIAGGPATHLGTNNNLHSVAALAADSTFIYVIARGFGGGQESEGIYRLRRDQLSDPTAAPVLVYGGGHNWNDTAGGLFLDRTGTNEWLYFRTYNPAHVHMLLDPSSASPLYMGTLWEQTTNNQTGLGYDPAAPALFMIDHDHSDDRWLRID